MHYIPHPSRRGQGAAPEDEEHHWQGRGPRQFERLLCGPIRPGFVLQLEEHRQPKTVNHFRFVERDKFRLVQDRVNQRAEHHLKRKPDAARLRRDPAPAHPRKQ